MKKQNRKPNNKNTTGLNPKFAYSSEEIEKIDREIELEKKQQEAEELSYFDEEDDDEEEEIEQAERELSIIAEHGLIHHIRNNGNYKVRLGVIIATLVLVLVVAMNVGAGMAMIELNKTPADFFNLFKPKEAMAKELYDEYYAEEAEQTVAGDFSDEDIIKYDDNSAKEGSDVSKEESTSAEEAEGTSTDTASTDTASEDEAAKIVIDEETNGDEDVPENVITQQEMEESMQEAAEWDNEYPREEDAPKDDLFNFDEVKRADSSDDGMADANVYDSIAGMDINDLYPMPFTTVDESYFEDALLIGDSRFLGFAMWSGLPATNYCITSFSIFNIDSTKVVATENGKVPIFQALPYDAFTKIYIKVGLNEMGTPEDKFEAKYAEVIARLREQEPRAVIYVNAILPVTAAKSRSDKTHNNTNIAKRNEALKKFAESQKAYFIDAGPYVSGDDGALKAEMTNDGIHMGAKHMGLWKKCLLEHAVLVD